MPALAATLAMSSPVIPGARLQPESIAGWNTYAAVTERRIARELTVQDRFLAMDFTPNAAADRRAALAGAIVMRQSETRNERGDELDVPSALVHHWRGAVFIPKVRLKDLVARLQAVAPPAQDDVLRSAIVARGPDWTRLYLKLQRTKLVTVVYNTEHMVKYQSHNATRVSSASTATKIAELADAGTPQEHELPQGDDRGFLWRLNAYWRYEEVPGGVMAECESISLSRDIPFVFRYLVRPMVESAARESMEKTLRALRGRFAS
jgi:hypothetical protein